MKNIYLGLAILGALVPLSAFVPWLYEHGFSPILFLEHAFANHISVFAWLDVIVAAVVLIVFIVSDRGKKNIRFSGWAIVATLCVGVSFGLPLYLYLREKQNTQANSNSI